MSNWDGGVRANAFVSGGFLPHKVRGTKYAGLIAIWDWYSTLCAFGGVVATDARAAAASLPPLDSLSMHEVLLGAVHDPTAFHWPCMRRAKRPTTTARQTHNIHHTDRQTDRQTGRQTDRHMCFIMYVGLLVFRACRHWTVTATPPGTWHRASAGLFVGSGWHQRQRADRTGRKREALETTHWPHLGGWVDVTDLPQSHH
jgi:hypothetical protein